MNLRNNAIMYFRNRYILFHLFILIFFSVFFITCSNNVKTSDVSIQKEVQIVSGNHTSSYSILPDNSTIKWYGGFKIGSQEHNGLVKIKEGILQMDGEKIVDGILYIDMKSIKNIDMQDTKENNKIVAHLKSKDFFYVDSHATAILKIKNIVYPILATEQSSKENLCDINAYLTIKGITHEISFPASYSFINDQIYLKSNMKIDRNRWGISYANSSTINIIKEKIIDDFITFDIKIQAKRE